MGGNIDNSLELLSQTLQADHQAYAGRVTHPYFYIQQVASAVGLLADPSTPIALATGGTVAGTFTVAGLGTLVEGLRTSVRADGEETLDVIISDITGLTITVGLAETPGTLDLSAYTVAKNASVLSMSASNTIWELLGLPFGMRTMGRYVNVATWQNLVNGQFGCFRLTQDGKLMTDATFSGAITVNTDPIRFNRRFYVEITVTDADQAISFVDAVHGAFLADLIMIANDDAANAVYYDYGAAAVADANHGKVLDGEVFESQYQSGNIHVICAAGLTALIRVWGWAEA